MKNSLQPIDNAVVQYAQACWPEAEARVNRYLSALGVPVAIREELVEQVLRQARVQFDGSDLLALPPEERARRGLFLAFQYPVEIPGVANIYLLKGAVNARRKHLGLPELDAIEFLQLVRRQLGALGMDESFLQRGVNEGFSGGEKKRNEMLQMALLEPRLAILDETDSGLDVDALKTVADRVNAMRAPDRAFMLITHYERLLELIVPDRVLVLLGGRIVASGGAELARRIAADGYGWLQAEAIP